MTEIEAFQGSKYYSELLGSFTQLNKINFDPNSNNLSKAIFFHLIKMKSAAWKLKVDFKRSKRHSLSDFFQDIIAFYLKCTLPDDYIVEIEKVRDNVHVDIAIKKAGEYVFLIEVKTTIGYERPDMESVDPLKKLKDRIAVLSEKFNVPAENIIYVFEDHGNTPKAFSEMFWDRKLNIPKAKPTEFPLSNIRPLFNADDPFYWKHEKGFNKNNQYKEFSDEVILEKAEKSIVTKFEEIINQILTSTKSIQI